MLLGQAKVAAVKKHAYQADLNLKPSVMQKNMEIKQLKKSSASMSHYYGSEESKKTTCAKDQAEFSRKQSEVATARGHK